MQLKNQIVRPAQLAETLGVCTETLWHWRKKGILPEPNVYGPRCIGWPANVIEDWFKLQEEEAS